jgi:serpin B
LLESPRPPGELPAIDNNIFALALYGRLRSPAENLFVSPFSARTALAMAQGGARGETALQMARVLRLPGADEAAHAALAEFLRGIRTTGDRYVIRVANSLWGQEGAPLLPGFLALVTKHYDGHMAAVDFRRHPDAARAAINNWVEDRTQRRIRDLIPPGGVNALTRLVLANAVYFKGLWPDPFDVAETEDQPFSLERGGKVRVPLMHREGEIRYGQEKGYQAVDLIYQGGDLSMLVLLPDRKDGLADLEAGLSASGLNRCVDGMTRCTVDLFLPRFRITWGTVDLGAALAALGLALPFDQARADFSGINGLRPPDPESLFISSIYHKAFVEVNEEGTEAAAATASDITITALMPSPPPRIPVFRADHPFLFAIRDRRSGAFLFLGRVADPTRGA